MSFYIILTSFWGLGGQVGSRSENHGKRDPKIPNERTSILKLVGYFWHTLFQYFGGFLGRSFSHFGDQRLRNKDHLDSLFQECSSKGRHVKSGVSSR